MIPIQRRLHVAKEFERSRHATGSRVHAQRIAYSGGESSTKTMKYPARNVSGLSLAPEDAEEAERIAMAIREDAIGLLGPLDAYSFHLAESRPYSVLDFWFDTLCEGGVFAHSVADLLQTVLALSSTESAVRELLAQSPFAGVIDFRAAEKWLGVTRRTDPQKIPAPGAGGFLDGQ